MKVKKVFFLVMILCMAVSVNAQVKKTLKKAKSFKVTKEQAAQYQKNPMLRVEGLLVSPAKGYVLYSDNNYHFIVSKADILKGYGEEPSTLTTYFEVVTDDFTSDGAHFRQVCSCGSDMFDSDGDMCYVQADRHGINQCIGGCYEGNEGERCSFSVEVTHPDGRVVHYQ